jgi:hypothetical protein
MGQIWFGLLPGHPPFLSLYVRKTLGRSFQLSSTEIAMPASPVDVSNTVARVYLIALEHFNEMIKRDGFGAIRWRDQEETAFVTIEIQDNGLVADFIRVGELLDVALG